MDISYLDETGLKSLWAKIKNTFVNYNTYSSRNQSVDNRLAALEANVTMLKATVDRLSNGSGGSSGSGSTGGNTGSEDTTIIGLNKLENCSVSGNNTITVDGVEEGYTLVYLDSEGNVLSNCGNIEKNL